MIVVTGATGNVGRPLVTLLASAGAPVTAVARRVTPADVPAGVRAVPADLANAESLRLALDSADGLFLCPAGDLLGAAGDPRRLITVIGRAGVRKIVLLSSQAARTRPRAVSHARLREFEDAVMGSGMSWTILRPAGFASNSFAYIPSIRSAHVFAAPFGDVGLPVIDPADIAGVAQAALLVERDDSRAYTLTGPSLVTPRQQATAIGAATGTELTFTELTRDQALAAMTEFMPKPVAEGTLDILGDPTSEETAISPDAEKVLGRPPASYAEWATRNAAAFR